MKKDGVKDGYISSDLLLNIMCDEDKIRAGDIVRAAISTTHITCIEKLIQVAIFYDITEEKEKSMLLEKMTEKISALNQ